MKKIISIMLIGILFISTIILSTNTITATKEKEFVLNDESYEWGIIILDCNNISGLPENEHIGRLQDIDISTNGSTQGLFLIIPDWDFIFINENNQIHIRMDNFFGVFASYPCGKGSICGIGQNIEWGII